jgi:hypothetical protein
MSALVKLVFIANLFGRRSVRLFAGSAFVEPVLLTSFFDLGHVRLLIGGALVEDDFLEERRPTRALLRCSSRHDGLSLRRALQFVRQGRDLFDGCRQVLGALRLLPSCAGCFGGRLICLGCGGGDLFNSFFHLA